MNIYIGNLSRTTSETDLRTTFEKFGEVSRVSIIKDKYTGEAKGFGFVEMSTKDAGMQAIADLNGRELDGRNLSVNEARPRTDNGAGNRRSGGGNEYKRSW